MLSARGDAGLGAGAGLGLGFRLILAGKFGWGISFFTLVALVLMNPFLSSSRSFCLAASSVTVACFIEMRSRMLSRALPALRLAPNSFSSTA